MLSLRGVSYPPACSSLYLLVLWVLPECQPLALQTVQLWNLSSGFRAPVTLPDGVSEEQDLVVLGALNLGFGPDGEAFLRRQSPQRQEEARSRDLGPGDPWGGDALSVLRDPVP